MILYSVYLKFLNLYYIFDLIFILQIEDYENERCSEFVGKMFKKNSEKYNYY